MYFKMTCSITLSRLSFKYKATPINYYGPVCLKMSFLKKRKLCSAVVLIKFGHHRLPYVATIRHNMAALYSVRGM